MFQLSKECFGLWDTQNTPAITLQQLWYSLCQLSVLPLQWGFSNLFVLFGASPKQEDRCVPNTIPLILGQAELQQARDETADMQVGAAFQEEAAAAADAAVPALRAV